LPSGRTSRAKVASGLARDGPRGRSALMLALQVEHLAKTYGRNEHAVPAIEDLTFDVHRGEFVCIVGPSGCGKTTLLKCLSGLLAPTGGDVRLHDSVVEGPPEKMALVFQEYSRSLFPWMTVRQNVAFPLRRRRLEKAAARGL